MTYLTMTGDQLKELEPAPREELRAWLAAAGLDLGTVVRVTVPDDPGGSVLVTEAELDDSSPYLAHIRIVPPGRLQEVPAHLRDHFEVAPQPVY